MLAAVLEAGRVIQVLGLQTILSEAQVVCLEIQLQEQLLYLVEVQEEMQELVEIQEQPTEVVVEVVEVVEEMLVQTAALV